MIHAPSFRTACLALLSLLCSSLSHAMCVNPGNPAESPVSGVRMYFDIHLPTQSGAPDGFLNRRSDPNQWPAMAAENAYGLPLGQRNDVSAYWNDWTRPGDVFPKPFNDLAGFFHVDSQGFGTLRPEADGRPPPVWANQVDPEQRDKKKLQPHGGAIFYYEPNGKGGQRLCRVERWLNRRTLMNWDGDKGVSEKRTTPITTPAAVDQTRNATLAALSKDYFLIGYANLRYNAQGQLPHIGPVCYYFKPDGQVDWVGFESDDHQCLGKKPDPTKEAFIEVLFDANGKGYGAILTRPRQWEGSDVRTNKKSANRSDQGWYAQWHFRYRGGKIFATANDRAGLDFLRIDGGDWGAEDDTPYNKTGDGATFEMGRGTRLMRTYEFPTGASTELLRKPETLFQHDRVRTTGSGMLLFERFAPGTPGKLTTRIWYSRGNGNAPRQEFFKDGKLVRATVADFLKQDYWTENLSRYKNQIKAPFDNVYLRIYDYDTNGEESLAAIGWTDYPREKYFENRSGSKRAMLNEYQDMVARLMGNKPEAREEVPYELKYFFATPDLKKQWPDYEAMKKDIGPLYGKDAIQLIFPTGRRSRNY